MATDPFGVGVTVVEAAWELSTLTVPVILLGFLAYYAAMRDTDTVTTLVRGQRDMSLRYGVHLIIGLVMAGAAHLATGSLPIALAITGIAALYAVHTQELPGGEAVTLDAWRDKLHLFWILTPVLAAAAVVSMHPLLQSLTALVFYGVIFWEI